MLKVLVVDDDQGLRLSVKSALAVTQRFEVDEAFDGVNAMEKVKNGDKKYDLVLLDVDMPRMNGLEALRQIKEFDPGIIVIIMTAHATFESAIQAVKDGAYNYLQKPVAGDDLLALIDKAVNAHNLISNIAASAPVMVEEGRKIIGHTSQMQKVFNIIHRLAKVETPVLIRGASGTGKELVAKAIHFNSARKDEKFVAINCSAIPENLFESELFGHEKGSFTGADQRKIGKFQFAEGGTLFLDEVGDMPQLMQVKILRVLQEKLFTPVGSNREFPTNVRIIAATNRPLEDMIKAGTFREDLFYRLNVVPIFLPALAERKDDMEHMVNIFIRKFNQAHGKRINGIAPDAMAVLKKHSWPGNIRELENVIEHAFVLEMSNIITIASLPEALLIATGTNLIDVPPVQETAQNVASAGISSAAQAHASLGDDEDSDVGGMDLDEEDGEMIAYSGENLDFNAQKEAFEKEFIIKALKTFRGRINQTALHANIPKKTLLRKIEKYGIIAKDYSN
ncbi:sigma-54 dependent transcriptional regulator [Bdellovibrio bacteriovorus]|uniref:sigma-54-dependent transcriptional regulator n=1 Tax=Bdellovibrio bacteriovorus TaxID=959 RepID=UPI0003074A26|nr:sigma-54 dependent transcriptional regulator [Bdellovibrio bacteriovorus]AHZ83725.1 chemotaxis protein CheY [Bdellovibrio bacteriovorus]BEV69698.1 Anaerobic nitric oxide reductase transcription regulator NorR [Bdellovibrio bacteriovorus]